MLLHARPAVENLVEGKDVAQTEARIAQYQHDNRARELRRTVAALNERQGAGLEGVSAEQAAAHAGTVDGNGAEEDAGVIEEIQRLVEETPAEEAEVIALGDRGVAGMRGLAMAQWQAAACSFAETGPHRGRMGREARQAKS